MADDRPAREPDAEDAIEITLEMIAAGLAVFRNRDAFDVFADASLEALVCEAYAEMRKRQIRPLERSDIIVRRKTKVKIERR